jgi:hypothetical protein
MVDSNSSSSVKKLILSNYEMGDTLGTGKLNNKSNH